LTLPDGVVFLGEKTDVVAQRKHALEEFVGFVAASLHLPNLREPQAAREKCAFVGFAGRGLGGGGLAGRPFKPIAPVAQHETPIRFRSIARTVCSTRGSFGGRKPNSGNSSRLASSRSLSYDWVNAFTRGLKPCASTSSRIAAARRFHLPIGAL
jgi:hypothetical protein